MGHWHDGCFDEYTCAHQDRKEDTMPMYFFNVEAAPNAGVELVEVTAPDFVKAVETLAAWRPGIHILSLEGVCSGSPGHA